MANVKIKVVLEGDPEEVEKVLLDPASLQSLCRAEVENFHQHLKAYGHEYADGLDDLERASLSVLLEGTIRKYGMTDFTKKTASGFLYQKAKEHI